MTKLIFTIIFTIGIRSYGHKSKETNTVYDETCESGSDNSEEADT